MINYEYEELFRQDSIDKQIVLQEVVGVPYWLAIQKWTFTDFVITNDEIHQESFQLNQAICTERELQFGYPQSSYISFTTTCLEPLAGRRFLLMIIPDHHTEKPLPINIYKVVSDNLTADKTKREVVAYDLLYDIVNSDISTWWNSLWSSIQRTDLRTIVSDFCQNYIGCYVTRDLDGNANWSNVTYSKMISPQELSGKEFLRCVCEIIGGFCKCSIGAIYGGTGGNPKYVFYNITFFNIEYSTNPIYPRIDLYPSNDIYPIYDGPNDATEIGINGDYISIDYEDYFVQPIDKLQIRKEENDIGCVIGEGSNMYIVEDNFFLYGLSASDLETIGTVLYDKISRIYYVPATITLKGNPCIEVGDFVYVHTKQREVLTVIMQRNLKGVQAMRDEYVSTGKEYRLNDVNTTNKEIIQLKGKTTTIEKNVDGITAVVQEDILDTTNPSSLASLISQNATAIEAKVSETYGDNTSSFSWVLKSTGFDVKNTGTSVFKVNSSGAEINGKVTAKSGYIGNGSSGFEINNANIHNGMTSLSDTSHDGIYLGTDGIALGKSKFKVDNSGSASMTSGIIGAWTFSSNGFTFDHSQGATGYLRPVSAGSLGGIEIGAQTLSLAGSRTASLKGDTETDIYTDLLYHKSAATAVQFYSDTSKFYSFNPVISSSYMQATSFNPTSDKNVKKNIVPLDVDKSKNFIMGLNPCEYNLNIDDSKHHGFIAQEVEKLLVDDWDVVAEGPGTNDEKIKTLAYMDIIADLVATVQSQQKQIDNLQERINMLILDREGDLK